MEHNRKLFLLLVVVLAIMLGGCSLSSNSSTPDGDEEIEIIDTFKFVTDSKMTIQSDDDYEYYLLTLHAGEKYQVQTDVDSKLGDDYSFIYSSDDDIEGKFTLTSDGYIETNADLAKSEVFSVDADLYKDGKYARVAHKYFIFSILVEKYADIVLTNDGLIYDADTNTYSLTMDSGNSYAISYSISSNTAYSLSFSLSDPEYSSFMSVDSEGKISTVKTNENKTSEIKIELIGADGVLDTAYLKVNLNKDEELANTLKVVNQANAAVINDGDRLNLYVNDELSFDVKYNGEAKTNVISVSNPAVLELDGTANRIKAIGVGECEVKFACEVKKIVLTVNVSEDNVVSLSSENDECDFIIINGELRFLGKMQVAYASGAKKEIDKSLITTSITDKDECYKTVVFTYAEDSVEVSASYDVKFYEVSEYVGQTTAYDNNDYLEKYYTGEIAALPTEGEVKILVIPVWFTDSDYFFSEAQKEQIIDDIEYTVNGDRPATELNSLKQYYEEQSYGTITMDITVSDFYVSSTSYEDYTDYEESKKYNSRILGTDAIRWYFDNNEEESLEDYDLNSDGYLDGLIIYYGANYYGAPEDRNRSVAFEASNNDNKAFLFNTMAFCPIGGLYGLDLMEPNAQTQISDLSATYNRGFRISSKTAIHEVGHMFGNSDLYEEQFASERYSPAGGFVMQDSNYGGHDPYHVNKIGWSKPQIYASSDYTLGDKITILLSDFQSSGQNIILTNTWNTANSLYDEYLILELFTTTGLNTFSSNVTFNGLLNNGIRLWHVNSLLENYSEGGALTSEIIDDNVYDLAYSNYDVTSEFDLLHMIRNNPAEEYNTTSRQHGDAALFDVGDSFDMDTFGSQFVNGGKLDSGKKLGWAFTVEAIYENSDGTYDAIITLERTENVKTDFNTTVALNRSDLETPDGEEEYGDEIFGTGGEFSLVYKYVTPPSVYNQSYPISSNGMCLFASADGNGGYIDLTIKEIGGKEVVINSISITYSCLTNAAPTVIVDGGAVAGQKIETESKALGFKYDVNAKTVRIQNQYSETIDHWSVLPLLEITIDYTIK